MGEDGRVVFGGVDTHRDTHVAAVVDGAGRVLGTAPFGADRVGYEQLEDWLRLQGRVSRVGVEGTGSYGAGLARYLTTAGVEVVEVNRPNRQLRRQRGGKTDSVDAEAAARAAASGQARTVPKSGVGPVECIRMLLVARRSATKARTQAANQIHSVTVTAPEPLKRQLRGLKLKARVRGLCPLASRTSTDHSRVREDGSTLPRPPIPSPRHRNRRTQGIEIRRLCAEANPAPLAAKGVGPDTAATLLVAAGDNPGRMKSERSFAALCGASPVPASSGQTIRHRLNRGGNRQANNALWPMRYHPDTPRRSHQPIRGTAPGGSKEPKRDHPLPQAAHHPTGLPTADQPATNPELRPAPPPTSTRQHHRHPGRPTTRNPPQPHLRTRTRPRPQPPTRQPIPDLAPHPPTRPLTDLTTIGASMSHLSPNL